ncbi:MAG: NAD-dependent epimerase/dehydratase family protein [Pseudomonadota bacterium]|jgi:UDP-glucose 4-epimerase
MSNDAKCVVIGGAGFIGRHVVARLVATGRRVTVLGRSNPDSVRLPREVKYVAGDYGNRATLEQFVTAGAEVIDLAYATVPQTSFGDPVFDILSNLPAAVGLLQVAVAAKVKRLVLASSGGTVYGRALELPIRETHLTAPISPYGITKLAIERYAAMFREVSNLHVVIVRPANAYGEEQRPFAGQGFIATAIHSVLQDRELTVFGPKGTIRDYIHVSDVAAGIVAALEHGASGAIYNVGTGVGSSNRDILDLIAPMARQAGREIKVNTLAERAFDVPANVLDSSSLGTTSGWRAEVPLPEGLERVWRVARESTAA